MVCWHKNWGWGKESVLCVSKPSWKSSKYPQINLLFAMNNILCVIMSYERFPGCNIFLYFLVFRDKWLWFVLLWLRNKLSCGYFDDLFLFGTTYTINKVCCSGNRCFVQFEFTLRMRCSCASNLLQLLYNFLWPGLVKSNQWVPIELEFEFWWNKLVRWFHFAVWQTEFEEALNCGWDVFFKYNALLITSLLNAISERRKQLNPTILIPWYWSTKCVHRSSPLFPVLLL